MLSKGQNGRDVMAMVWLEDLVPKDHLLRKIDAAVDFDKLYEMVEDLYSEDNGRPSIDPVVLVKMVLIQHLYGLPSLRRTASEVEVNMAYRWFLGYGLQDETPHFSTLSSHHDFRGGFLICRNLRKAPHEAGQKIIPRAMFQFLFVVRLCTHKQ